MDTIKEFKRIMDTQTEIALATIGTDGTPNVRIVNYYFNPTNNVLYFATFKDNEKYMLFVNFMVQVNYCSLHMPLF